MPKRFLIGALMMLAGVGLLTPTVWLLCSPFLAYTVSGSGSGMMGWLTAALGGSALLASGLRRLIPARA
jgi:hypothetical protein